MATIVLKAVHLIFSDAPCLRHKTRPWRKKCEGKFDEQMPWPTINGNEKEEERTANGADRAQAGSRYRQELDVGRRAPFVSVVFFFRGDHE